MSLREPILCYSNYFPRCIYYPFRIWNSWCDVHEIVCELSSETLQCNVCVSLDLEDGGWWDTWKQLFREEVPVSIKVRTHSGSQKGSQVGLGTDTLCMHVSVCVCVRLQQDACAYVHVPLCRQPLTSLRRKAPQWGYWAVTQNKQRLESSASGQVSKWVCYNRTKPITAGLRGPRWPPQAFAVGTQKLLSANTRG